MGLFDWLFGPGEQTFEQEGVMVKIVRTVNLVITGDSEPMQIVGCECGKTLIATFHSPAARTFTCPGCGSVHHRSESLENNRDDDVDDNGD